jgi:CubicO group peptidase (beta-lactamase class C family)
MNKKIVGICICLLMIGTILFPVTEKLSNSVIANQNPIENIPHNSLSLTTISFNDSIDDYIINEMANNHIPGLSASITRNDRMIWSESYGYANINQNLLVKDTTLFILASISKTITATAIMQLYEQGYFDLNDSINDYLPFSVINPNFPSTNITFHMLLTHSSSIRDNWGVMPSYTGDSPIPLGEYLENYLTPGGAYYYPNSNFYPEEPGTVFNYCNVAVALVGYLVEVISGMPFDDYCKINIFDPLDMDETAWFLADLNVSNIAVPYVWNGNDYVSYPQYGVSFYPAAQLRTSTTQLSHFLLMMMNNGTYNSTQILEESTVNQMLTLQLPFYPHVGIIWMRLIGDGRTLWGHSGSSDGCRTEMWFEPQTHIGVNVLTNGESDAVHTILLILFNYAETINLPPNPPTITGPAKGKINVSTMYNFTTTHPGGDEVYYFVDWGDQTNSTWIGPYPSGDLITKSHTWSKKGTYIIQAKAKNVHGNESDWGTLTITMPFSYEPPHLRFFEWLFERFPHAFPILRQLLGY